MYIYICIIYIIYINYILYIYIYIYICIFSYVFVSSSHLDVSLFGTQSQTYFKIKLDRTNAVSQYTTPPSMPLFAPTPVEAT